MTAPVRVLHVVHSLPMSGYMSVLASNTARRWEAQLLLGLDALASNTARRWEAQLLLGLDALASNTARRWEAQLLLGLDAVMQ
uniref:Uncharacterized protein n=1 Tax=Peronospora matthiolae TaxID=2874970 RepID=A0AAV1VJR3_9STRA